MKFRDTLKEILTIYAGYAIDMGDLDAESTRTKFGELTASLADDERLPQVKAEFTNHRQAESQFFNLSLGDLQKIVWILINYVCDDYKDETQSQSDIDVHLKNLKDALGHNDISALKKETKNTIALLEKLKKDREKEKQESFKSVGKQIRNLRKKLEETRMALSVDGLTGIYNRKTFDEQLEKVYQLSFLTGQPTTLLMIDIDHFKKFNDQHGHLAGDKVLIEFARFLQGQFPRKTDIVCRYGGEEFAVILGQDDGKVGAKLATKLLHGLHDLTIEWEKKPLSITASIGIAELQISDSIEGWVKRADEALYSAKAEGRDRVSGP